MSPEGLQNFGGEGERILLVRGKSPGTAGRCWMSTAAVTAEGSAAQGTFEGKGLASKGRGSVLKGHL